ncbi:MAG TPA: hypothetical protein VJS12_07655 [Steroidobacteraceae bacterium]|nr:hypothetical protein [Steroidobacteraceae bacterium]
MTPAALLATPAGITANCAVSGTFKAKMADELPRVLHVKFDDCTTLYFGIERFLDGPIVMTLPADTFQPEHVQNVRLGNDSAEFLELIHSQSPEQNSEDTYAFRIVLRGDLALWYAATRTSSLVMNGYYDQRRLLEFPPGTPAQFYDFKTVADRLSVVLSRTTSESGLLDNDLHVLEHGSVTFENTQPPPWGSWTDAYSFNDLRVRYIIDYAAMTNQETIDGKMNVTWNRFAGPGCMNGLYTFKTRVPLLQPDGVAAFESGELVVNGDVVTRFYSAANTPPGLPTPVNGMLVNMKVRDVDTFNYDIGNWFTGLLPLSQCP